MKGCDTPDMMVVTTEMVPMMVCSEKLEVANDASARQRYFQRSQLTSERRTVAEGVDVAHQRDRGPQQPQLPPLPEHDICPSATAAVGDLHNASILVTPMPCSMLLAPSLGTSALPGCAAGASTSVFSECAVSSGGLSCESVGSRSPALNAAGTSRRAGFDIASTFACFGLDG